MELTKFANLHLHSIYSDGVFTPLQLVRLGKSLNYKAIALTDHENDAGIAPLMSAADAEGGIEIMTGAEFYGMHEGFNLHLTALDFDMSHPAIRALIEERVTLHYENTRTRFMIGVERGLIEGISWDDVERANEDGAWYCFGSVARAYKALGIPMPSDLHASVFKLPVENPHAPNTPTAERVISTVRAAGGIIALAHPYNRTHFVPALVGMGLNGIEVSHPDNKENTPELALEAARTYNLYHCGGTDHTGPMSGLGGRHATPAFHGVTEEEYYTIKERRRDK